MSKAERTMSDALGITRGLGGKWYGYYGLAFCPAHANRRTPALRLANGRDGRLLALCSAGCTFEAVSGALRGMGLVEGRGCYAPPDPFDERRRRNEEHKHVEKRRRQALEVWHKAIPIGCTLAERYLRTRAITADLPPTLRFHDACWHPAAKYLPALVALVEREGEMEPVGVHRIYLAEPGRKADADPVKASLGPIAGGAVRLAVGRIGTVGKAAARNPCTNGEPLVVAEGIETALSLPTATLGPSPTIWAALSTSGMAGLRLPEGFPGRLIIASDNDAAGRGAATALGDRAWALGWTVQHLSPPDGQADWNEAVQQRGTC
jgi:hypothetical protein